jgi:hypothetical protein
MSLLGFSLLACLTKGVNFSTKVKLLLVQSLKKRFRDLLLLT